MPTTHAHSPSAARTGGPLAPSPRVVRITLTLATLAGLAHLAGCYERVVDSRGIGAMGEVNQDEYRSNTAADRAVDRIFGEEEKPRRSPYPAVSPLPGSRRRN